MLVQTKSRRIPLWAIRVARMALFATLIALSARVQVTLDISPVPVTAQTLAIMFTGMVLGPVEGTLSTLSYLLAIAAGAPIDARGLGPLVFASPTAGYLVGFIPGTFLAGLAWQVKNTWLRFGLSFLCGLLASAVILTLGRYGVALSTGADYTTTLVLGVYPFVVIEAAKAIIAAGLSATGRESWLRWSTKMDNR